MAKTWDSVTAAQLVDKIYQRVLERGPDEGGLVYWGGKLERGELSVREEVREVGQSVEYFNKFVANSAAKDAARQMYKHFLAREPENQYVVEYWGDRVADNWRAAVDGFVDSAEYAQRFGDDNVPAPK